MDFFTEEELYILPDPVEPVFRKQASNNAERLLVLVSESELTEEITDLLSKICDASGFAFDSKVSILGMEQFKQTSVASLVELSGAQTILSFGLHEEALLTQFHKVKYKWIRLNHSYLLFADSLDQISQDQRKKMQLWNTLKEKVSS